MEPTRNYQLTDKELHLVGLGLGKMPYETSVELINKLQAQYNALMIKPKEEDEVKTHVNAE